MGAQQERKSAEMPSTRRLASPIICVLAGVAMIVSTPIAAADIADDVYLAQLRALGFSWPPDHDQGILGMAHLVCDDLYWGWTQDHIAQQSHETLDARGVTYGQVSSMIQLATATYCPYLTPQT